MSKYERAKEAARVWHEKYVTEVESRKRLEEQLERWKSLAESLPDEDSLKSLQEENKNLSKAVKALKKQLSDVEGAHQDTLAKLQRERIILEGKIQQLEEACRQKQERYDELKEDYRYSQSLLRGKPDRDFLERYSRSLKG